MASANSSLQLTELDFDQIKQNFLAYLKGLPGNPYQDYNFEGSALNILVDLLAYNTHYNAFYLNMVGNEMFLDTASQRDSVVSHAKLLNYTPKSAVCPTAFVDITVRGVTTSSLTLQKGTTLQSEPIDNVNYPFVVVNDSTVSTVNTVATFTNIEIKQGEFITMNFTADTLNNPDSIFTIPDTNIDTSTLSVVVQTTSSSNVQTVFTAASSVLALTGTSNVYFLQEGPNGQYQIYFGDGVLGSALTDGNYITISYLSTSGTAAAGANNFVVQNPISGFSNITVTPLVQADAGSAAETIDSIKFTAPKAYSAQGRAVTKDDYITLIQQNTLGYSFDAVNVWGGEENNPPVYGQVFISLKPAGAYTLTDTQKQRLITDVIKPISVLTVVPTLLDPDYTYIKIGANVLYDSTKTILTAPQLQTAIANSINNFALSTLNTFNSTFSATDLNNAVKYTDPSIVANEAEIQLQKKFYPSLTVPATYTFDYGVPLQRGMLTSGINSSPAIQYRDPTNLSNIIDGIYIEEVPVTTGGVASISVLNPGFGYSVPPTVTILGDGTGATAVAVLNAAGNIKSITVTNPGTGYTSAIATVTNAPSDSTGRLGALNVTLEGQFGTLRMFYNNSKNVKTIFLENVGTVDYVNGIVTLKSFAPYGVDNDLGQLAITVNPQSTIISSTYNKIITVDPFDPTAVTVSVTAKSRK